MAVLMVVIPDQMEDMVAMEQIPSDHISPINRQEELVVHRGYVMHYFDVLYVEFFIAS